MAPLAQDANLQYSPQMLPLIFVLPALAAETSAASEPVVPAPTTTTILAQYRAEKLTVQRYVRAGSGAHVRSEYYRGDTRLWGSQVYDILGHPELVQQYHRRNATNVGFVVAGAATMLGGFALGLSNHVVFGDNDIGIGGALTLVGAGSIGIGILNRPDRGDWDEVNGWIDSYNVALAQRLGVPLTVTAP